MEEQMGNILSGKTVLYLVHNRGSINILYYCSTQQNLIKYEADYPSLKESRVQWWAIEMICTSVCNALILMEEDSLSLLPEDKPHRAETVINNQ